MVEIRPFSCLRPFGSEVGILDEDAEASIIYSTKYIRMIHNPAFSPVKYISRQCAVQMHRPCHHLMCLCKAAHKMIRDGLLYQQTAPIHFCSAYIVSRMEL